MQDGMLDILLLEQSGRIASIGYFQSVLRGKLQERDDVKHIRSDRITIEVKPDDTDSGRHGDNIRVQADGDPLTHLPCEIGIDRRAVSLTVPESRANELA